MGVGKFFAVGVAVFCLGLWGCLVLAWCFWVCFCSLSVFFYVV